MSQCLTVAQFAETAGIKRQPAGRAVRKGQWREHPLVIRVEHGRGGAGGKRYMVRLDSLPAELQERARELWPELAEATPALPRSSDEEPRQAGKPPRRKLRQDAGRSRLPHCLNRLVRDGALTREAALEIARQGREYAKGAWASALGQTGSRQVARATTLLLRDLCHEAGVPGAELLKIEATRDYVSKFDVRKHRKVHTFKHDAKRFHDAMPAVRRDWSMLDRPLEILIGDGTALDIRFLRPDGGEWKIWLILWMDGKTGRLFGNAYARPKGGGVRQEHTAFSFALLAEQAGLPEALMVDRGGEYGWVDLLDGAVRVIKTLPYGARSKPIEPAIRVFQVSYLALIAGYIGNDRLRKRTQSVGRPAAPFAGSLYELFAEIAAAIDAFNARPQRRLGGLSPNQAWQEALDSGWQPNRADIETMTEALAAPSGARSGAAPSRSKAQPTARPSFRITRWTASSSLCAFPSCRATRPRSSIRRAGSSRWSTSRRLTIRSTARGHAKPDA